MFCRLSLLTAAVLASTTVFADESIERIEVTGDFVQESLQTLSASAVQFTEQDIAVRGAVHLADLLNVAANVNFASGASRGRYVQIRGIGERSQFVDPINASVGLQIDHISYAGIGHAALLFDNQDVTIYRGPQGTRFGADALAGLIDIHSNDAANQDGSVHFGLGNYQQKSWRFANGKQLTEQFSARVALLQQQSDGYIHNAFLNRDDTAGTDEQAFKLATLWQHSVDASTKVNLHYIDINNGYDNFSLDNTRTTLSDQPGHDQLLSKAVALEHQQTGWHAADLLVIATALNADSQYGYDEDWAYDGMHEYGYSSTDDYDRQLQRRSVEVRLNGKQKLFNDKSQWLSGVFYEQQSQGLARNYTYENPFASEFTLDRSAWFGQLITDVAPAVQLISGIRIEHSQWQYDDSNGISRDNSATDWGLKLALEYQVTDATMIYTALNHGYKIGGVNGQALGKTFAPEYAAVKDKLLEHSTFAAEQLWNGEFGVKGSNLDGSKTVRVAAFYMYRDDVQTKQYLVNGTKFVDYIGNATSGRNYGIEAEYQWQYSEKLRFETQLGWLKSSLNSETTSIDGRDQAHAPRYQYSFQGYWSLADHWTWQAGVEGKAKFYFSDSHDQQSGHSNLVNTSLQYQQDDIALRFWVRNLFDQQYANRGFYFGNDPRDDYTEKAYYQWAEPRVMGVDFELSF